MAKKRHKTKQRQHTVPRIYLARFAGTDGRLCVFDKPTGKLFQNTAENLTREEYFYDTDDSENQQVEDWFATEIETELGRDLAHFDEQIHRVRVTSIDGQVGIVGRLGIPFQIRASIAHGMILQHLRTRASRSDTDQAMRTALAGLGRLTARAELGYDPGPLDVSFHEYFLPQQQRKMFADPEWVTVATKVMRYPMAVLLAEHGRRFYTSDNPVIMYHADESPGWLLPDVELYFPLSPNTVLAFCNSARFEPLDDCLLRIESSLVDFLNARQVVSANRQVYCSAPDWGVVKDTLAKFPQLAKTDRPRMRIDMPDWFGDAKAKR